MPSNTASGCQSLTNNARIAAGVYSKIHRDADNCSKFANHGNPMLKTKAKAPAETSNGKAEGNAEAPDADTLQRAKEIFQAAFFRHLQLSLGKDKY